MDEKQRYEAGMQVRRAVLGDAHVERSLANLTPFNEEFQEMITRHAWGDIWTRPGLPRHTRSLVTIAMLIGMNRNEELKLHLRAAKNNGVSRDEIKEVIMQSAIYCGIPRPTRPSTWPNRCGTSLAWSRSRRPGRPPGGAIGRANGVAGVIRRGGASPAIRRRFPEGRQLRHPFGPP